VEPMSTRDEPFLAPAPEKDSEDDLLSPTGPEDALSPGRPDDDLASFTGPDDDVISELLVLFMVEGVSSIDCSGLEVVSVVVVVVSVVSVTPSSPSLMTFPEVNKLTNNNGTKSTITIFLLKNVARYPIKMNKIVNLVLPNMIYTITLNSAKKDTKNRTYRFVNNFETELGIFIGIYIFIVKKIEIKRLIFYKYYSIYSLNMSQSLMTNKFALIICELHNKNIHGFTEESDANVEGHYLVTETFNQANVNLKKVSKIGRIYARKYRHLTQNLLDHSIIRNYQAIVASNKYIQPQIAECIYLSGDERVAILKTHWICLIQRNWRRVYDEQQRIIRMRCDARQLRHREITGSWAKDCLHLPSLRGILSGI